MTLLFFNIAFLKNDTNFAKLWHLGVLSEQQL